MLENSGRPWRFGKAPRFTVLAFARKIIERLHFSLLKINGFRSSHKLQKWTGDLF